MDRGRKGKRKEEVPVQLKKRRGEGKKKNLSNTT